MSIGRLTAFRCHELLGQDKNCLVIAPNTVLYKYPYSYDSFAVYLHGYKIWWINANFECLTLAGKPTRLTKNRLQDITDYIVYQRGEKYYFSKSLYGKIDNSESFEIFPKSIVEIDNAKGDNNIRITHIK